MYAEVSRQRLITDTGLSHLPAQAKPPQRLAFLFSCLWEEVAIDHSVHEPFPVLLCYIRNKPGISLAMETNLLRQATLDEEVG